MVAATTPQLHNGRTHDSPSQRPLATETPALQQAKLATHTSKCIWICSQKFMHLVGLFRFYLFVAAFCRPFRHWRSWQIKLSALYPHGCIPRRRWCTKCIRVFVEIASVWVRPKLAEWKNVLTVIANKNCQTNLLLISYLLCYTNNALSVCVDMYVLVIKLIYLQCDWLEKISCISLNQSANCLDLTAPNAKPLADWSLSAWQWCIPALWETSDELISKFIYTLTTIDYWSSVHSFLH